MPLDIVIEQKRRLMLIHLLLEYTKVFAKPLLLSVSAFVLAWFQDSLLLQVENVTDIDFVMPAAKAVSSVVALTLSGLSGYYAHSRWIGAREDSYMKKVDWLLDKGYITKESTPAEIKEVIKDHFK